MREPAKHTQGSSAQGHQFRAPVAKDFESWFALYEKYAVAVKAEVDRRIGHIVWAWLMDPQHPAECVVVIKNEAVVAFAHFRSFPRTLDGNQAGYLDDLYVCEDQRGSGLGRELIQHVGALGKARGWSHLRWVTFEDSEARKLYERIAKRTDLLTYVL
ncbi:MAG: GNAT family N-acetyltransferase [Candidatus Eremiobacteraeota bacterium]|nr:GNAT family N-acetyltransferase [Candidatus Eremiobacteraeota bacterium]